MSELMELSKSDLQWLEDKFVRYPKLNREIAIRKEEKKLMNQDTNTGGGKSNIPGRPVENEVISDMSDKFITQREEWKKAIKRTVDSSSEEYRSIIYDKYWSDYSYLSWTEIGEKHFISSRQIYRVRYKILERFAKEIGYI